MDNRRKIRRIPDQDQMMERLRMKILSLSEKMKDLIESGPDSFGWDQYRGEISEIMEEIDLNLDILQTFSSLIDRCPSCGYLFRRYHE